jgi:hypothetical protein
MMKIKDIEKALEIFEEACIKHSEATEQGDYKTGNKYHSKILKAVTFLKSENAISNLKDCLSSPFVGVRLWSACYWLPVNEQEGIKVLEEIVKSPGINSLTAETTLSEWKKGNLKF